MSINGLGSFWLFAAFRGVCIFFLGVLAARGEFFLYE